MYFRLIKIIISVPVRVCPVFLSQHSLFHSHLFPTSFVSGTDLFRRFTASVFIYIIILHVSVSQ